jgi:hypothetical protein
LPHWVFWRWVSWVGLVGLDWIGEGGLISILTSEATPRLTGSGFAVARVRVAARRVRRRRVRVWNFILAVGWGVEWCVVEYRRSLGI